MRHKWVLGRVCIDWKLVKEMIKVRGWPEEEGEEEEKEIEEEKEGEEKGEKKRNKKKKTTRMTKNREK